MIMSGGMHVLHVMNIECCMYICDIYNTCVCVLLSHTCAGNTEQEVLKEHLQLKSHKCTLYDKISTCRVVFKHNLPNAVLSCTDVLSLMLTPVR